MRRTTFNDGWRVRPFVHSFLETGESGAPWTQVTLPHDALITSQRDAGQAGGSGYFPGGIFEYQKDVEISAELVGKRVELEFEGVYRSAKVYVNGQYAGERPYGYSVFRVPVDHLLKYGDTNQFRVEARSHKDSRWYTGAGIHRATHLVVGEPVHVPADGLRIATRDVGSKGSFVEIEVEVVNAGSATSIATAVVELRDADGEVVTTGSAPVTTYPGERAIVRQHLLLREAARWSVERPYLYTCRALLSEGDVLLDEVASTFGVRTVSVDAVNGLLINGEPVLLRGACVHHDNGVLGAAAIARAEERRVEILKQAGFNALRSAHNPMSVAMLDACDRLGMLVIDEAFDSWTRPKTEDDYATSFRRWWRDDVAAMVNRGRNHPSVIMYSIGNEIPEVGTPLGARLSRQLAEHVRSLDDTRLVTAAVSGLLVGGSELFAALGGEPASTPDEDLGVNTLMSSRFERIGQAVRHPMVGDKSAESFSVLDVAGYNYLESRYEMDGELYPHRVIVGTETLPASIDRTWGQVRRLPHVIGDFTWTGWDYLGEVGIGRTSYDGGSEDADFHGAYPWLAAWCGDIDLTGHRRPMSYYREIVFGLRSEPYIAVQRAEHHGKTLTQQTPWAWSDAIASWTWDGHEDQPVTVEVYSDADEVELWQDGQVIGRAPAGEEHRFRAEFETTYRPGELLAVAYRDGQEAGRWALRTAAPPAALHLAADRTEIRADDTDVCFVSVELVDDAGQVHTASDRPVTVFVEGPAVLQGFGSADPRSDESFAATTRTTFDGRALAVLRPTGPGAVTLTATAEGCRAGRADIRAVTLGDAR